MADNFNDLQYMAETFGRTKYQERYQCYYNQYGNDESARQAAIEETLDEIHLMLFELCKHKGLLNDESIRGQQEVPRSD